MTISPARTAPFLTRALIGLGLLAVAACQTLPYAQPDADLPEAVAVADASAERAALNAQVYDAAVGLVDRLYYDPAKVGDGWRAAVTGHRPAALAAPTEAGLYQAIDDLLETLDDRHTSATSPAARALRAAYDQSEDVVSFGMSVVREGSDYVVNRVRADSPAATAGVRPGWRIVSVNGHPGVVAVVPSETRADAFVFRDEAGAEHAVSLTGVRLTPRARRMATRRDDGVLVLRFDGFTTADRDWLDDQLDLIAAVPPKGVILDLRDNTGGRLDILAEVVGDFIPGRPTFAVSRGRFGVQSQRARAQANAWTGPLAAMIGPGSASAAELLASTIQTRRRGPVVGRRSAGAVIGAYDLNLPDGGELSVSSVAILTGDRTLLEKVGVTPDVVVEPTLDDQRAGRDVTLEAAARAVLLTSQDRSS